MSATIDTTSGAGGGQVSTPGSRRGAGFRRALRMDIRLHRADLLGYLVGAAFFILLAVLGIRLGVILILWAACMPAILGRTDRPGLSQLRGALGISRADVVRARTVLVCSVQFVLAILVVVIMLLAPETATDPDDQPMTRQVTVSDDGHLMVPTVHLWWDVVTWVWAIIAVHIMSGRDALRRSTRLNVIGGLACYAGAYVLSTVLIVGLNQLILWVVYVVGGEDSFIRRFWFQHDPQLVSLSLLYLAVIIGLLVLRCRAWARQA